MKQKLTSFPQCRLAYSFKERLISSYCSLDQGCLKNNAFTRGGVEDTRLEAKAKAKDTKKIRGQGQGQGQPFRGQTLSRPRTGMLEAKAKDQGHKRKCSPKKKKKKVFTKIFQAISTKKRFLKNFSSAPQNFNNSKNSAVLEPRTGQFSRTWGLEAKAKDLTFEAKAKDFKICPRGQGRPRGLHLWPLPSRRLYGCVYSSPFRVRSHFTVRTVLL